MNVWEVASGELLATLHHVHEGFHWTTPAEQLASHGWLWTDREDLVIIDEPDADEAKRKILEETDQRRRDYLALYNNQRRVMRRVKLRRAEDRNRIGALLSLHNSLRRSEGETKLLLHSEVSSTVDNRFDSGGATNGGGVRGNPV